MGHLRQGTKVPRHIYWQVGARPADTDPYVCTAETVGLAVLIVEAVNDQHDFELPEQARP